MSATVRVHLLGRDYLLRSQGEPDRVQEAAALVEEKLAGLNGTASVDTRDRFMLALLNLAGEYLQEEYRAKRLEGELQRLQADQEAADLQLLQLEAGLVERIEEALNH